MGVIFSSSAKAFQRKVVRTFRNYNVEERAMRAIAKEKPIAAPTHPATAKIMEEIVRDPSKLKSGRTDPHFLQRLSKVHITSEGVNPNVERRKLPTDRTAQDELLYGYGEPKFLPPGKANLRQLLEIIANNTRDPDARVDVEQIAKEYKIDVVDVMNILQYCKTLLIIIPPKEEKPKSTNPLRRFQDGIDNLKR